MSQPLSSLHTLDLIIPIFNEEAVLPALIDRLNAVFSPDALQRARLSSVRYLLVDDGSSDQSVVILQKKIQSGWNAQVLCLSRNFGHQAALTAGMDHSRADLIGIIDADLQDPPELLLEMVGRLNEGSDVVYGERRSRNEAWYKKCAYWFFYRFIRLVSSQQMPMDAGDFCVMRREVLRALQQLPEKLRFHRGLRSWVGFRQTGLPYDRPERYAGFSKYKIAALYALATDGIASLSIRPLRITQAILFFSLLITTGIIAVAMLQTYGVGAYSPLLRPLLLILFLVAFTSSLQIFSLYVMGAYIGRMYLEVKNRPAYIVKDTPND